MSGYLGQIGRELKKLLDGQGNHSIMTIDLKSGNDVSQTHAKINADVFFHLASFCKIKETIQNPQLSNIDSNSTFRALELCRQNKIPYFIYFSSIRTLSKNKTPYTATKIYGEELVKAYAECYGIKYLIIRPSSVYGGFDETKRLIQIWIDNAKQGTDLVIYGNKNKSLNFTYISDFLEGLIKTLQGEWNKEHNICGDSVKLIDVAKEIIKQTNSKSKIVFTKPEIGQPQEGKLKPTNNKINYKEGIKKCLI